MNKILVAIGCVLCAATTHAQDSAITFGNYEKEGVTEFYIINVSTINHELIISRSYPDSSKVITPQRLQLAAKDTLYLSTLQLEEDFDAKKIKMTVSAMPNPFSKRKSGQLTQAEFKKLKGYLEKALDTVLPAGKSILINYDQNAQKCAAAKYSKRKNLKKISNRIQRSAEISAAYNVVDFFVYEKYAFLRQEYQQHKRFIKDIGFFYEHVLTDHDICKGFLVLKPNGRFLKYYGENYYTQVEDFLSQADTAQNYED